MDVLYRNHRRSQVLKQTWEGRVENWHSHVTDTPAFAAIRESLLERARPALTDVAVDLGAGTGFVAVPLAQRVHQVIAVDVSDAMLAVLRANAETENIRTLTIDLDFLDLKSGSVDLIVSNYALHHLTDPQKQRLLRRCYQWLRPGGRIVIADMMLGRGTSARDRAIARRKAALLLRRGPAGIWRIAKNVARFTLRMGTERPVTPQRWVSMLRSAGFDDVACVDLVAEAGLAWGVKPATA